jgi:hypothetical protein
VLGSAERAGRHLRAAQHLGVPLSPIDAREAQLAAWRALSATASKETPP